MSQTNWGSLIAAATVNFFYYGLIGGVISFLAVLLTTRGFSSAEIGGLIAAYTFIRIFSGQLWAYLADRQQNPKLYFQIAIGLSFVTLLPSLFVTLKWVTSVSLTTSLVFFMAAVSQIEVLSLAAAKDDPTKYNRVRLFGSIGFIVAAIVVGAIVEHLGAEYILPFGLLLILVTFVSSFKLANSDQIAVEDSTIDSGFIARCTQFGFLSFMIASILLQMSFAPYVGFFTQYLSLHNYSGTTTGVLFALGTFSEIFIFLIAGHLLAKYSIKMLMVTCLLLTSLRWGLLAFFTDLASVVIVSQFIHAASFGLMHSASIHFIRNYFPKKFQNQGQFMYLGITFGIGGTLGAWLTGYTWQEGAGGEFTFIWSSIVVGLAGLLILMTPKNKFQFNPTKLSV